VVPQDANDELVIELRGPFTAAQADLLCSHGVTVMGAGAGHEITCDVYGRIDLSVIDVLARLQLLARRSGAFLRIRSPGSTGEALHSLLALTGLACLEQTRFEPLEALEPRRQAETGE
jgi:hypothetical protein